MPCKWLPEPDALCHRLPMFVPTPLPPGVVAEQYTYRNGATTTIYRAPFQVDGPTRFAEGDNRVLAYMYASFVFTWHAGSTTVDISHGRIQCANLVLYRRVPISGPWHETTLARFGRAWAHRRMSRFQT